MNISIDNLKFPENRDFGTLFYLLEGDIDIRIEDGSIVLREFSVPVVQLYQAAKEWLHSGTNIEYFEFAPDDYLLNPMLAATRSPCGYDLIGVDMGSRTSNRVPEEEIRQVMHDLYDKIGAML